MIKLFPGALVISLLFSAHGFRKGSLDTSGAFAAFAVGYLSLANDLKCGSDLSCASTCVLLRAF